MQSLIKNVLSAGILHSALCIGLFALLVWSFRRYTAEEELAIRNLEDAEKHHRAFLDNLPALIWVAGTDRRCTFFNQTWLKFTGRTLEQEQGTGWTNGIHADDTDRRLKTFQTAFDARQPFTMEYRLRNSDGQYRWILDFGTPWFETDGQFAGYIGGSHDITDRRRANETLRLRDQAIHQRLVCLAGRKMGWLTRFELATSGITTRRSNQLSYSHHRSGINVGASLDARSRSVKRRQIGPPASPVATA